MLPSSSALIFLFVSRVLIYWNFVTWNIITRKYIYFSNNFFTKDSRKTTISKSVKTVKKKKNWKSLAWLIIIPFVFPRLFRGCSRGDGGETFAHRKPFGAASNNAHTTMYDTLADSSRSSSSHRASAFCEPSKPTLSPTSVPGVRCRLALSSPLLSSPLPPFPLLSASTALIHRHREGCSAARTRASAKWFSTPSRDPFQPLFSFLYTPRHALYPCRCAHPPRLDEDSSRGRDQPLRQRFRFCLHAARILPS